jgi:anti-anti-sigma regulatory factor
MLISKRAVSIHKVPHEISSKSKLELLRRLEMYFENGCPRFVLDCSQMDTIGPAEVNLLLCCLEEAMKHKGDVRLAQLQPQADAVLRRVGAGRLFEIFDTSENAVSSYGAHTSSMASLSMEVAEMETENAA